MKKIYNHVLWDLDGTITEPSKGIFASLHYALKAFNCDVEGDEPLRKFIGPPLMDSFQNFCGMDEQTARLAMEKYRELYAEEGIFQCKVYDGVPELMAKIAASGKKNYLATSKPEVFARKLMDHFGLSQYIEFIGGSDIEETRVQKWDIINYVIESCKLGNKKDQMILIGDRKFDILGAKKCGIQAVGILWGFGSKQEFRENGAELICETPFDVERVIFDINL